MNNQPTKKELIDDLVKHKDDLVKHKRRLKKANKMIDQLIKVIFNMNEEKKI